MTPERVAVGTNACLDLVANATASLDAAGMQAIDAKVRLVLFGFA